MSDCETIRQLLYSYLDEELGADEAVLVREHLEACPECGRAAAAERRFLARIAETCRETAPASLRARVEGILEKEAGRASDEGPEEAAVRPISSSPRWRRALVPVAAAAALALLLIRPWGDAPSAARAASFAADYAGHAVVAPSSHPFPPGTETPEAPGLAGARLIGLSRCVVNGGVYAHYTYAIGEDRHVSVFLPLGDAPLPDGGSAREGAMAVLTVGEGGVRPGAVLVSADLGADELRSLWPET